MTLAPHLAELVCAAGGCSKLVGVAAYTDYPAEAAARPQVGDAFSANPERVIALQPDLVLAWEGGNSPSMTAKLEALGIPVRRMAVRTLGEVADRLVELGALLGTREAAALAAQGYRERLAALRARYQGRAPLRVLYQIEVEPIYTINHDSPISEAIEICGGVNVFAGLPQLSGPISKEAVLAADPDVVVFGQQDYVGPIRAFWAQWPHTRAQRHKNLYAVDASLLARQGPRLLDGVQQLCEALETARERGR